MTSRKTAVIAASVSTTAIAALIGWRFWRHARIPLIETELDLEMTTASPHQLDRRVFAGDALPQFIRTGVGPLFHRRYYVDIAGVEMVREALMAEIIQHLNTFTAWDMAIFQKLTDPDSSEMEIGDDYFVHIAGPWNGPVRTIDVTPTSFSFITLQGHLEAGEIQFRLVDHPEHENLVRFEIRSWSRSRDRIVDFFYNWLRVARFAQTQLWVYFCQRVVEVSGGEAVDEVHVMTHRVPWRHFEQNLPSSLEKWQQYMPRLEALRQSALNFELDKRENFIEANGWNIDAYGIDLPEEAPGPPEPGGSWEQAKGVVLNYEFPDPKLISGIFIPTDPLNERVMLLEAHFMGFTFRFGVRIGTVIDEMREDPEKGPVKVWGYSYQTLQGHFEMGEITFEIWKYTDSGKVEFRVHSYSKTGRIRNPFYRVGFRVFGRRLQKRFANTALQRMQEIVVSRMAGNQEPVEKPDIEFVSDADEVK